MQPQDDASTAITPILLITLEVEEIVFLEGQHHCRGRTAAQFVSSSWPRDMCEGAAARDGFWSF
jgi:hypothetical protein